MRTIKILLPLLLIIFLIPTTTSAQKKSGWLPFSAEHENLFIKFPYEWRKTDEEKSFGELTTVTSVLDEMNFKFSFFSHSTIPDLDERIELAKTSFETIVEETKGTIIEKKVWEVKDDEGIQGTINIPEIDAKLEYKVILIEEVQIQIYTFAKNDKYNQKLANKFFKSFKLKY